MTQDFNGYLSPFGWRYGSTEMRSLWSEQNKRLIWRRIWVVLAEVQVEYGLVTREQAADLRAHMQAVDLPRALDHALDAFVRLVSVQGGWFAIRRGDSLEGRAQWDAPSCADLVLSLDAHTLLRRMNRNLAPMAVNRGDPLWSQIPHKGLKASTKAWICVPLVIGQRLIGAVGVWRFTAFKGDRPDKGARGDVGKRDDDIDQGDPDENHKKDVRPV